MCDVHRVFNDTWTVAGWKRCWWIIPGNPEITWFAGRNTLSGMSGWAPFIDRAGAMRFIRQIRVIQQRNDQLEHKQDLAALDRKDSSPVSPAGL